MHPYAARNTTQTSFACANYADYARAAHGLRAFGEDAQAEQPRQQPVDADHRLAQRAVAEGQRQARVDDQLEGVEQQEAQARPTTVARAVSRGARRLRYRSAGRPPPRLSVRRVWRGRSVRRA